MKLEYEDRYWDLPSCIYKYLNKPFPFKQNIKKLVANKMIFFVHNLKLNLKSIRRVKVNPPSEKQPFYVILFFLVICLNFGKNDFYIFLELQ